MESGINSIQNDTQNNLNINEQMSKISNAVNEILKNITIKENELVSTKEICDAAEKIVNSKIDIYSMPLKKIIGRKFMDCGAVTTKNNDNSFTIVLNSDKDAKYQRFSLIHEIGHIVLDAHNFKIGKFVASFHINYQINHLNNIENDVQLNEEIANIFALCVLMPKERFLIDVLEKDIYTVSKIYGVTPEAVRSRFDLILE